MELQKINVKFFAVEKEAVPLTAFIDVFHGWIQATDGIYHDVADYSHIQSGPGIVLVTHEANVSVDETKGQRGLLYSQKARLEGSNEQKIRHVLDAGLEYCRRLEDEPIFNGKLTFQRDEIEIAINDRLSAPNTDENFLEIKTVVGEVLSNGYGARSLSLDRNGNPSSRLTVRAKIDEPLEISTLRRNLGVEEGIRQRRSGGCNGQL